MDFPELNEPNRRVWQANADFWDQRIGGGNDFQLQLVEPATHRLLDVKPAERVLDLGCGAGRLARQLAAKGGRVTAVDFCEAFIRRAREYRQEAGEPVEYRLVDVTDAGHLLALGEGRFDAAVATMMLMDLACISPLLTALPKLLRPEGRFVFSLCHPCFQPPEMDKFAESTDADGVYRTRSGVKFSAYRTGRPVKGLGIIGQPQAQYYFHRSLADLLGAAFAAGFVLDGLEEPTFDAKEAKPGGLRWNDMPEIPPVLVARLRVSSSA